MILGLSSGRVRFAPWLILSIGVVFVLMFVRSADPQEEAGGTGATITTLQTRLAGLDPQVGYLRDRRDIFDASKRYTRGADRHDKELVRSAFWPEATISYGTPMGLDEYVEWEENMLAGYAAHQHHVTGQTLDIDGDTAHVESYVIYFLVPRDRSADEAGPASPGRALTSEKTHLGSGRYVERWERRNGEWKILVREYVEDLALKGETVDVCGSGCLGTWDRNDLSYLRPLEHQTPEQRRARADANRRPRSPQGSGSASGARP
jgi:hypothetical protein